MKATIWNKDKLAKQFKSNEFVLT